MSSIGSVVSNSAMNSSLRIQYKNETTFGIPLFLWRKILCGGRATCSLDFFFFFAFWTYLLQQIEQRRALSRRIIEQYPDRVPVIVEKVPGANVPEIKKKKWLPQHNITKMLLDFFPQEMLLLANFWRRLGSSLVNIQLACNLTE